MANYGPVGCGLLVLLALAACSQPAPQASGPTSAPPPAAASAASPAATLPARFDPTAAVGGGTNASGSLSPDDVAKVFAAVQQASGLKMEANASPPGATGDGVTSVSITAQDAGGVLKGLDATAKKTFGEALLAAAGTAWPKATVTLLVSDPSGSGGQIIGTRPPGGPNTVIAT
jgi:hypothetical protein